MFFMKSGTIVPWRLFRTYMILFQEGYKLLQALVAELYIDKEM